MKTQVPREMRKIKTTITNGTLANRFDELHRTHNTMVRLFWFRQRCVRCGQRSIKPEIARKYRKKKTTSFFLSSPI